MVLQIKRSGELSRTFEVVDEDLGINVKHIKGKTTVFKKGKNEKYFYPKELTAFPFKEVLLRNIETYEDRKIVDVVQK